MILCFDSEQTLPEHRTNDQKPITIRQRLTANPRLRQHRLEIAELDWLGQIFSCTRRFALGN
jgi:hypothetical protein